MTASLNAARRARDLTALQGEVVDLLVVGLGVTGAGIALDGASRGLSVAAIDAHDLAFGTSRWSSKLVHGGLRYLAQGRLGIARESAAERGILMTRTAPHLVRATPFLVPLTRSVSRPQATLLRAGLLAGDLLRAAAGTPRSVLPGPRRLQAVEALNLAPALRSGDVHGGLLSWDGRLEDDARLVVAIGRTAAAHGARVLTRCRALTLDATGASVRDELTGETFSVRARGVINATGVWAGGLDPSVRLRPSRGTHLVFRPGTFGDLAAGLHIPVPGEANRYVVVLPQDDGRVYAGLTDEPVSGPIPDVPVAPEADIGFILDVLASVLDVPLRREHVAGAFAGLRPLPDGAGRTADLSRDHVVHASPEGIVTVTGGKLTTYRRMAEDALDATGLTAAPCRTRRLPLVGAAPPSRLAALAAPRRLVRRYGAEAPRIQELIDADPALAAPVTPGTEITRAELAFAVLHEGALNADDLLDRRTRIGLIPADRTAALPAAEGTFPPLQASN